MTRQSFKVSADNAPDNPPSKRRKLSHHDSHHQEASTIQSPTGPPLQSKTSKSKSKQKQKSASRRTRTLKSQPPRQSRPITQYSHGQLETNQTNRLRAKSFPRSSLSSIKKISSASASTSGTATPVPEHSTNVKLSTTKSLLDQIWARNKNQHRSQPWWKSLGMLRKAITHLVAMDEAEHSLKLLQGSTASIDAKQVRQRFKQETQIRREREVWHGWMREVLVPRAYVGFTALVADTQFAALGVVLVGILADVMGVVGAPTPTPMEDDQRARAQQSGGVRGALDLTQKVPGMSQSLSKTLTARSLRVTGSQSGEVVERMYDSDDLGEVVERTNLNRNRNGNGNGNSGVVDTPPLGAESLRSISIPVDAGADAAAAALGLDDSMATVDNDNAGKVGGPSVPVSDPKQQNHRMNTYVQEGANPKEDLSIGTPPESASPSPRHRLLSMEAESDRAQNQKPDTTTIKRRRSRTDERALQQELQASASKPKSSSNNNNNSSRTESKAKPKAKAKVNVKETPTTDTMTVTKTTPSVAAITAATPAAAAAAAATALAKPKKMSATTATATAPVTAMSTKKAKEKEKDKKEMKMKKKKNAIDDMFSGFI
ncbi:RNase MRP subunit [Exophiala dermatitidis]|nr:RNase MRP subunit [Exophiala dermatitidis]